MIISEDNLEFNTELIEECISEMESVNKSDFMNNLVNERLSIYNDNYIVKFDQIVDNLYDTAVNCDFKKMGMLIKRLTRVNSTLYNIELKFYKSLCIGDISNESK